MSTQARDIQLLHFQCNLELTFPQGTQSLHKIVQFWRMPLF